MAYDQLKLENQLCFPLYAVSRQIIRAYKPFLDPLNITYTQYITLMALWEHDGASVKELGRLLHLDSGTLTPLLKKMERQHLVERIRSQADERTVHIHLTEKGWALQDAASEIPAKLASSFELSQDDGMALYRILHVILAQDGP